MIKNYLKIAFRNVMKYKFYSIINVLGLALGISCFLFILLYVKDELSYDLYHEKGDRIHRLGFFGKIGETEANVPEVGLPVGPNMKQDFPEVENFVRFREKGERLIRFEENSFKESNIIFADSTLFDVFSFKLLQGDPKSALAAPFSVIITPQISEKYFGNEDPIGKTLIFDNETNYKVTGIIEELPRNSHFRYDIFCSLYSLEELKREVWSSMNFHTYLLLRPDADPAAVKAKLPELLKTKMGAEIEKIMGVKWEELMSEASGNHAAFTLMPLEDIYLHSHTMDELAARGDIRYIYIFSFIGLFILLLACINFMNLATARSATRAREVGVRKVIGAGKPQLIGQFLSESLLISFFALLLSIIAVQFALPYFNELTGKELGGGLAEQQWIWLLMLPLVALVGIVAGGYPAFFLSAFKPVKVLKGILGRSASDSKLRNGLVVFQFFITTILIAGTIVIFQQLKFIQNKKLGFDKEQLLVLHDAYVLGDNLKAYKEEMLQYPAVVNASQTSFLPTPSARNTSAYFLGKSPENQPTQIVQNWRVDEAYIPTMGMEIIAGRNFSPEFKTDSSAVLINEKAARVFGINTLNGQQVSNFQGGTFDDPKAKNFDVIGIVKNFHFSSLRDEIQPMVIHLGNSRTYLVFRVNTQNISGFIYQLQSKWSEMAPYQPFSYSFLDEDFANVYTTEVRVGKIIGIFAFLAIFIACIGLFGLATFVAEQKTKEIGIRKVLGASVANVVALLSKDFLKLVLAALVISIPLAWYFMNRWLEGFAYHTEIKWWVFGLTGMVAIIIAFLTVSIQSVRAALGNPINALRSE